MKIIVLICLLFFHFKSSNGFAFSFGDHPGPQQWAQFNPADMDTALPMMSRPQNYGSSSCVPIPKNMSLCQGLQYSKMRLPNLLEHDTVDEAQEQSASWVHLKNMKCHPDTQMFLCSLFAPVCLERPIYPCRSLCEAVKSSCEEKMLKFGYPWPEMVKCDKFPLDNDMCMSTMSKTDSESAACRACSQPENPESLLDNYCRADFVIRARVRRASGSSVLRTKNTKVFKVTEGILSKKDLKTPTFKNANMSDCCAELDRKITRKSAPLLIMGTRDGDGGLVPTFIMEWKRKSAAFKKSVRMMSKINCAHPGLLDQNPVDPVTQLDRRPMRKGARHHARMSEEEEDEDTSESMEEIPTTRTMRNHRPQHHERNPHAVPKIQFDLSENFRRDFELRSRLAEEERRKEMEREKERQERERLAAQQRENLERRKKKAERRKNKNERRTTTTTTTTTTEAVDVFDSMQVHGGVDTNDEEMIPILHEVELLRLKELEEARQKHEASSTTTTTSTTSRPQHRTHSPTTESGQRKQQRKHKHRVMASTTEEPPSTTQEIRTTTIELEFDDSKEEKNESEHSIGFEKNRHEADEMSVGQESRVFETAIDIGPNGEVKPHEEVHIDTKHHIIVKEESAEDITTTEESRVGEHNDHTMKIPTDEQIVKLAEEGEKQMVRTTTIRTEEYLPVSTISTTHVPSREHTSSRRPTPHHLTLEEEEIHDVRHHNGHRSHHDGDYPEAVGSSEAVENATMDSEYKETTETDQEVEEAGEEVTHHQVEHQDHHNNDHHKHVKQHQEEHNETEGEEAVNTQVHHHHHHHNTNGEGHHRHHGGHVLPENTDEQENTSKSQLDMLTEQQSNIDSVTTEFSLEPKSDRDQHHTEHRVHHGQQHEETTERNNQNQGHGHHFQHEVHSEDRHGHHGNRHGQHVSGHHGRTHHASRIPDQPTPFEHNPKVHEERRPQDHGHDVHERQDSHEGRVVHEHSPQEERETHAHVPHEERDKDDDERVLFGERLPHEEHEKDSGRIQFGQRLPHEERSKDGERAQFGERLPHEPHKPHQQHIPHEEHGQHEVHTPHQERGQHAHIPHDTRGQSENHGAHGSVLYEEHGSHRQQHGNHNQHVPHGKHNDHHKEVNVELKPEGTHHHEVTTETSDTGEGHGKGRHHSRGEGEWWKNADKPSEDGEPIRHNGEHHRHHHHHHPHHHESTTEAANDQSTHHASSPDSFFPFPSSSNSPTTAPEIVVERSTPAENVYTVFPVFPSTMDDVRRFGEEATEESATDVADEEGTESEDYMLSTTDAPSTTTPSTTTTTTTTEPPTTVTEARQRKGRKRKNERRRHHRKRKEEKEATSVAPEVENVSNPFNHGEMVVL